MTDLKKLNWCLDLYGVDRRDAESEAKISKLLSVVNRVVFNDAGSIQLTPVLSNVNPQNKGISGVINAPFGHFAVRTFSRRGVAFIDLFSETLASCEKCMARNGLLLDALKQYLRYGGCYLRTENDGKGSFGVHIVMQGSYITYRRAHKIIERIVTAIAATPLSQRMSRRKTGNYDILQPVTESHIAVHGQREEDRTFIDIFSCRPFAWAELSEVLTDYHVELQPVLRISHGVKMKDKCF